VVVVGVVVVVVVDLLLLDAIIVLVEEEDVEDLTMVVVVEEVVEGVVVVTTTTTTRKRPRRQTLLPPTTTHYHQMLPPLKGILRRTERCRLVEDVTMALAAVEEDEERDAIMRVENRRLPEVVATYLWRTNPIILPVAWKLLPMPTLTRQLIRTQPITLPTVTTRIIRLEKDTTEETVVVVVGDEVVDAVDMLVVEEVNPIGMLHRSSMANKRIAKETNSRRRKHHQLIRDPTVNLRRM